VIAQQAIRPQRQSVAPWADDIPVAQYLGLVDGLGAGGTVHLLISWCST